METSQTQKHLVGFDLGQRLQAAEKDVMDMILCDINQVLLMWTPSLPMML